MYDHPRQMEPLIPSDNKGELANLSVELIRASAALGASLRPETRASVIELLRQMNSYYSNLIEGHATHPIAIEKALKDDYAKEPAKRALQIESRAHVEVQRLIEERLRVEPDINICSQEFIRWIHQEFYERMPNEFLSVHDNVSKADYRFEPGALRMREVEVGRHLAPTYDSLPEFLERFADFYDPRKKNGIDKIIAAAASHHRLAWIHPFVDGNGRVARLFTHAYLIKAQVDGHKLWMVSRGFARRRDEYRSHLAGADSPRINDLDGRGNLSDLRLREFCEFFLRTAIDQVQFMTALLDPSGLENRVARYIEKRASLKELDPASVFLLREALLRGEVPRGESYRILGKPERTARRIIGELLAENLLTSETPKSNLRMGFPTKAVGYYFPRLYPEGVEQQLGP